MKPTVIAYTSTTLDGYTTGFEADLGRHYAIAQQFGEDATLAGCDTLLAASPSEPDANENEPAQPATGITRPALIVADSRGRLKSWAFWKRQPMWHDWFALCTETTPAEHRDYLDQLAVKSIVAGQDRIDFRKAFDVLAQEHGIERVRLESGGVLNGFLLSEGLVDELHLLVHPTLLGDETARRFAQSSAGADGQRHGLELLKVERQPGDLVLLRYAVKTK